MEVCDVPEKDQEVVTYIIDDLVENTLGLTTTINWQYVKDRQSLVVHFEDQAVVEKFLDKFSWIPVDANVSYQVKRYKSEAVWVVEVLNVSDEFLVGCFFENLIGHSLLSTYDANKKLMVITFHELTEAETVLLQTTYQVEGHADVTVRKPPIVTRAISVTGIPASTTGAQLRMYFKGPRACGGAIESIVFASGDDHARIVFEDASVARAVASKQDHLFNKAHLSVRLADEEPASGGQSPPDSTSAAERLQATPDANEPVRVVEVLNVSDEFLVGCFFENVVGHNLFYKYEANKKLMVITFDDHTEAERILLQTVYEVEDHDEVTVRRPSKVIRAIRVSGLPKSASESHLKMYFKGARACGGAIESITFRPGDTHARIVFEDPNVARAVTCKQDHVLNQIHVFVTLDEDEGAAETPSSDGISVGKAALEANVLGSRGNSSALTVRNLPIDMDTSQLRRQMIRRWGAETENLSLSHNPSSGAAVICFTSASGLKRAVATKLTKDSTIEVCQTEKLSAVLGDIDLLVDGISLETSKEALWCWLKVVVGQFPHRIIYSTSNVKAIGQFTFSQGIDIKKITAAACDNMYIIDGKSLDITPVRRTASILVTNFKSDISEAMLKKYFENAKNHGIDGISVRVRLMETSAVVSFKNQEEMEALLQQQHKLTLGGQKLWLSHYYEELGTAGPYELLDFSQTIEELAMASGKKFVVDPQLIVKGFKDKVSDELLKKFLENRKMSSGGKIKSFVSVGDVATVTFEEAEAVDRICQKYLADGLSVAGCALSVSSKQIVDSLHAAKNKVLLRNFGEASEDSIKYFVWGTTGYPVKQLSFVHEPVDTSLCVIASFSSDIDSAHVMSCVRVLTLDGAKVDAEPIEEYSTLIVTNVPVDLHRDYLQLAIPFDLDRFYQQSPGVWLITPSDPKCIDSILHQPVTYEGQQLVFSIHSPFKAVENAREPGKRGRLQAELRSVPPAVVDFVLAKRKAALDALLEETGCTISISEQGMLTAVYSRHTRSAQCRSVQEHWRGVQQKLQAFFGEYILDPLQIVPGIWDTVLKSDAFNNAVNSCAADLAVVKPEPDAASTSRTLLLVGSKEAVQRAHDQVELAVRDINDKMERERQVTEVIEAGLSDWGIGLLKANGFFEALPVAFSGVTFKLDEGERQICLRGLPRDIQLCQTRIKEMLAGSVEHVLQWSAAAVELVSKESVRQLIDGRLSASGLAKSCFWWIGQDALVLVRGLTEESARGAAALITQQIADNKIALEPEAEQLLESDKWKTEVSTMGANRAGNVVITPRKNPFVLLAASLQSDANSLLEELRSFLHRHVIKKQFLRMSTVIIRLLTGSMKADVDKLEQSETKNSVRLEGALGPGQVGFHIEGNTDGCINIQRKIKDLIKKTKVVTQEHILNYPGASTALVASGSTVLLEVSRSSGTHIQIYDEDDVEQPESEDDAAAPGACDSSEENVVTLPGGVQVCVVKADITGFDCDVIVNPSNQHLHHVGGLAKVIADKAGPDMNQECQAHVQAAHGSLKEGDARITSSGKLRCKKVVHAVGPSWQGGSHNESYKLYMAVTQSLRLAAAESDCSSIAIPPISSGIFGYPIDMCTRTIVDSVMDYAEDPDSTSLKSIILIDINDIGVASFRRALGQKLGRVPGADSQETTDADSWADIAVGRSSVSSRRPQMPLHVPREEFVSTGRAVPVEDGFQDGMLMINGLHIELLQADLFKLKVESLVCTVTADLDLSKGILSQMLNKYAGPGLQQQLRSDNRMPIKDGDIVATAGHQLPNCKLVLLLCCPRCQQSTQSKVIKNLVLNCLDRADKQNVQSIAFPAIGTGNLGFAAEEVASNMFDALFEFSKQSQSLTHVKVVVAKDDIMSAFRVELRKTAARLPATTLASRSAAATTSPSTAGTAWWPRQPVPASSLTTLTGRELCFRLLEDGRQTRAGARKKLSGTGTYIPGASKGVQFGNVLVKVNEGDITDQTTDIIVNCTGETLSLDGQVARALTRKGGSVIAEECRRKGSIRGEGVFLGSGGSLSCHYILHVNSHLPAKDIVRKSLMKAEEANARSISFPAIGTGQIGKDPSAAAKDLFEAIASYTKDRKPSSLKVIQLVIPDTQVVPVFQQALQKVHVKHAVLSSTTSLASVESRESSVDLIDDVEDLLSDDDNVDPTTAFSVRLSITGPEAKHPLAIALLADECHARLETHTINDPREMILALTSDQVLRLTRTATRHGVQVEVNQLANSAQILLSSMNSLALRSMRAHVSELLLRGHTTRLQEEMVSAKAQWQYMPAGANEWLNYPRSVNAMLEMASKNGQPALKYGAPDNCYTVDFVKNLDCSEVHADDVVQVRRWDVQLSLPSEWSQQEGYIEVSLNPSSKEYLDVTKALKSTLADLKVTVIEVKRVQNLPLYQQYQTHKDRVKAGLSPGCKLEVERKLWHGTAEDTLQSICRKGFNRSYCGKNAVVYGQGVYFARDARYSSSDQYSAPNAAKEKFLIYCLVLTGEYELGSSTMKYTSIKPGQHMTQFETTVDQIPNPSIFVTYHDAQAYPAYIVRFKVG